MEIMLNHSNTHTKIDDFIEIQMQIREESKKVNKLKIPIITGIVFLILLMVGSQPIGLTITVSVIISLIGGVIIYRINKALKPIQDHLTVDINEHPEIFEACIERLKQQIKEQTDSKARIEKQIALNYFEKLMEQKLKK